MSECIYSFFDLFFDPEGKVFEKDPETSDNIHIVTELGEIKSLKIKSENIVKDFEPVKYEKNLILRVFNTLMKNTDLKEQVIQPIRQYISGKNENFYITSSFAIFLSLCNILSTEFNTPIFSEELLVKVALKQNENKWSKLFTRFWEIWSQIIFENQIVVNNYTFDSIEENNTKVYEESKEGESMIEKELREVLSEGGVDVPLVIEMVKNISQKQRRLQDNTNDTENSITSKNIKEPKIVEIKDSEESHRNDGNKQEEQRYQNLIDNLEKFKNKNISTSMLINHSEITGEIRNKEQNTEEQNIKEPLEKQKTFVNNTFSEVHKQDITKQIDLESFKQEVLKKITKLESQVLSITELVKKLVEKISDL
jgi:hypothetical protein